MRLNIRQLNNYGDQKNANYISNKESLNLYAQNLKTVCRYGKNCRKHETTDQVMWGWKQAKPMDNIMAVT